MNNNFDHNILGIKTFDDNEFIKNNWNEREVSFNRCNRIDDIINNYIDDIINRENSKEKSDLTQFFLNSCDGEYWELKYTTAISKEVITEPTRFFNTEKNVKRFVFKELFKMVEALEEKHKEEIFDSNISITRKNNDIIHVTLEVYNKEAV